MNTYKLKKDGSMYPYNARLEAAAPDLLELLYRCLPFIEDANEDPCYQPNRVKALENQIKALLALIEKG